MKADRVKRLRYLFRTLVPQGSWCLHALSFNLQKYFKYIYAAYFLQLALHDVYVTIGIQDDGFMRNDVGGGQLPNTFQS